MPVCQKCQMMQPTSEVKERREPHKGVWWCRDKDACKRRQLATPYTAADMELMGQRARGEKR
jgi:hypothetical protein